MVKKARKNKPRTYKSGHSSWSKSRKKWQRNFKNWWQNFFRRAGYFAFLILIIFVLLMGLMWRWLSHPSQFESFPDFISDQAYPSEEEFIAQIVPTAQELQEEYGVLASVSLAQAMLESDFGRSQLASEHYNLYGVKTSPDDPNKAIYPTLEYVDGEWVEVDEPFKVYSSWSDSMREHAVLISGGTTWDPGQYDAVLTGKSYQEQAKGLQSSGYATDPTYSDKIIELIENWDLDQYDQENTTTEEKNI
ncbi:glycoside hydrolase family 73 protein [Facklamia lactis]|nr:glycoside hydrolase family 73 protein [Facklamia lactis]